MVYRIELFENVVSKKNNHCIHRFGKQCQVCKAKSIAKVGLSKRLTDWIKLAEQQLENCRPWQGEYPLAVGFYYFRKTVRSFDFNNMNQGILDVLVNKGIIEEDNMKCVYPYEIGKGWEKDKDNPRVVILLSPWHISPLNTPKMDQFSEYVKGF